MWVERRQVETTGLEVQLKKKRGKEIKDDYEVKIFLKDLSQLSQLF